METEGYANFRRTVEALTAGLQGAADRGARWHRIIAAAAEERQPSAADVLDRATVILGLLHSSGFLADERIRFSLSIERFAEILADMIVDGVTETRALETLVAGEE